jgi:hypothetical protein
MSLFGRESMFDSRSIDDRWIEKTRFIRKSPMLN